MRHLRSIVLATVMVALCAAPAAGAHGSGKAVITPANGNLLGEAWAQLYRLPLSDNPAVGNGDLCRVVGHGVIQPMEDTSCTVRQGTAVMLGFGSAWSNVEAPYPETEAEQRAFSVISTART